MIKIELEEWQVKNLRNYFGENDKTQTAHWAYKLFNNALKQQCDIPVVSNCAFQYYNGSKVVCDKFEITLEEAKELWNKYYDDMVEKTTEDLEIEVAIWINMKNSTDYRETLIHLSSPEVRNGKLYEPKYYDKF